MKVVPLAVVVFLSIVWGVSADAMAQTTRPVPAAFGKLIERIGDGLVGGDSTAMSEALADDVNIDGFGESQRTAEKLLQAANGATLVSKRVYGQTPNNLASDLADDFSNAKEVPESVRREMMPDNDAVVRANVTAAQWIIQMLGPNRRQLIGVIVLCPRPESTPANMRPTPIKPIFVLIKAEMDGGKAKIKQMIFGNPLEQAN